MNTTATRRDLERFRAAIVSQIGLQFEDAKLGFLGEVLQRRMDEFRRSGDAYLWSLEQEPSRDEIAALARELTVGETYFFRNAEQFRALAEVVLPQRMRAHRSPAQLRLLSAGCASGEEPYSMAIVAQETIAAPSWDVAIRAVDINRAALERATDARYSAWALRNTPTDMRCKWFCADGREMVLAPSVRAAVTFEAANLTSGDPDLWQPGAYDVVFCRNVLMYFAPEQMRATIARIAQSLAPGGFLFLGHAETLRGISDEFHLRHTHGTFYYERKEGVGSSCRVAVPVAPAPAAGDVPCAVAGEGWVDAIRQATERVAALVAAPALANGCADNPGLPPNIVSALDLMREERFAEALDRIGVGTPDADRDADTLLLEATLLAHDRQFAAAEKACRRLLEIDRSNAGAHYMLALCREHAGDLKSAGEHDRVAAYLDPAFAMPRLHLGLLARRAGNRAAARRELAQALVLLKGEGPSRLLLFGGGFNREALLALCESALKETGGRP